MIADTHLVRGPGRATVQASNVLCADENRATVDEIRLSRREIEVQERLVRRSP